MRGFEHELAKVEAAVNEVVEELDQATERFGDFNSPHEGYAVVLEELDELWDEVKKKSGGVAPEDGGQDRQRMRKEARQVAAMALRFMVDLT